MAMPKFNKINRVFESWVFGKKLLLCPKRLHSNICNIFPTNKEEKNEEAKIRRKATDVKWLLSALHSARR